MNEHLKLKISNSRVARRDVGEGREPGAEALLSTCNRITHKHLLTRLAPDCLNLNLSRPELTGVT
jgi:hypothetical protein